MQNKILSDKFVSPIFDLISYFAWTIVYGQNNYHIYHMVWLIYGIGPLIFTEKNGDHKIMNNY